MNLGARMSVFFLGGPYSEIIVGLQEGVLVQIWLNSVPGARKPPQIFFIHNTRLSFRGKLSCDRQRGYITPQGFGNREIRRKPLIKGISWISIAGGEITTPLEKEVKS